MLCPAAAAAAAGHSFYPREVRSCLRARRIVALLCLRFLALQVPQLDAGQLGHMLMGASGDGSRISWLGYADLGGTVVAATIGLLVGLLRSAPLRFSDLALPVMDGNGDPAAVLGMHINLAWLTRELRSQSRLLLPVDDTSTTSIVVAPALPAPSGRPSGGRRSGRRRYACGQGCGRKEAAAWHPVFRTAKSAC